MKPLILLAAALTCVAVSAAEPDCTHDKQDVLRRATALGEAFSTGQWDQLVDGMYPPVVRSRGGRAKYIETIRSGLDQMAVRGARIERNSLGDPTSTYRDSTRSVCFVPREMVISLKDGRIKSRSYLVAVFDKAESPVWTFLDSAAYGDDVAELRRLFPSLPADLTLPPVANELLP